MEQVSTRANNHVPLASSDSVGRDRALGGDGFGSLGISETQPPRIKVVHIGVAEGVGAIVGEKEECGVGGCSGEYLLMTKMDDTSEVIALGDDAAERSAILRVKELVGDDITKAPTLAE